MVRAGGFTAFGLLTLSVALGLALSLRLQSARWPRIINSELHTFVTLLALIFTGIHLLAVWVDPFTRFGWNEVFLPFASHYRLVWMALGIVAFYLGIAIGLSTWLRPRIGYKLWRAFHILTLLLFGLVVVHGLATGSDTRTPWGVAIYASSVVLVGTLLWMRLRKPLTAKSRAHPVLAGAVVALVAIGTTWTLLGPLQPGWASSASSGGAAGPSANVPATPSPTQQPPMAPFPPSFAGDLQGYYTRSGPDANGIMTLQLDLSISNGPPGRVQVMLQGSSGDENRLSLTSSHVALVSSAGEHLFSGPLSTISGEERLKMTATLGGIGASNGSQMQVMLSIRLATNGQVTGTITTGAATPTGSGDSE